MSDNGKSIHFLTQKPTRNQRHPPRVCYSSRPAPFLKYEKVSTSTIPARLPSCSRQSALASHFTKKPRKLTSSLHKDSGQDVLVARGETQPLSRIYPQEKGRNPAPSRSALQAATCEQSFVQQRLAVMTPSRSTLRTGRLRLSRNFQDSCSRAGYPYPSKS